MKSFSKNFRYTWPAAWLAFSGVVCAESPAAAEAVERAARTHLLDLATTAGLGKPSVEITVLPRDPKIPCTRVERIDATDTRSTTRMHFDVECQNGVRAQFIVRGTVSADVLVLASDVRAGTALDRTMLKRERREIASISDAVSDMDLVVGKASRRALRSGQLVSRRALVEPLLVRRGAGVDIVARNAGVEVQVAGEALEPGRRGDIVQVRNKANGKVIRARVIGENSVAPVDISPPSR